MKTVTVKMYILFNMDWNPDSYERQFVFAESDISDSDWNNYVLIGTQNVEFQIPETTKEDIVTKGITKLDNQIKNIRAEMTCKIQAIENKKRDLLALTVSSKEA